MYIIYVLYICIIYIYIYVLYIYICIICMYYIYKYKDMMEIDGNWWTLMEDVQSRPLGSPHPPLSTGVSDRIDRIDPATSHWDTLRLVPLLEAATKLYTVALCGTWRLGPLVALALKRESEFCVGGCCWWQFAFLKCLEMSWNVLKYIECSWISSCKISPVALKSQL